jgi:hypothetical protein
MSQTALLQLAKVDKSKYTAQTLSTIDVMTCYFLDMIYNGLYFKMKDLKTIGTIDNITDGYKSALLSYHKGLSNNKNLKKCIDNIQRIFNEQPGYANMSFLDCINKIVEQFSPKDAFEGFNDKQRRIILKKVIVDVNAAFIDHILNKRLRLIIDKRKEQQSVQILKDELMSFFLLEREKILSEYYGVVLNIEKTGNISDQTAKRLQQIISETVSKMIIYKKKAEKFEEKSTQLKFELDQLKAELNQLKSGTKTLQNQSISYSKPSSTSKPEQPNTSKPSEPVESPESNQSYTKSPETSEPIETPSKPVLKTPQLSIQPITKQPDIDEQEDVSSESIMLEESSQELQKTLEKPQIENKPEEDDDEPDNIEIDDDFLELSDVKKEEVQQETEQDNLRQAPPIPKLTLDDLNIDEIPKDDPLATDSQDSDTSNQVKIKQSKSKKGKINIKRDAPVKKVQFV